MKADGLRKRTKRQNAKSKAEKRLEKIKKTRLNQEDDGKNNSDEPSDDENDMFKKVTKEELEKEDIDRKNFIVDGKFSDSDDDGISNKKHVFVKPPASALGQKKRSLSFLGETGQKKKPTKKPPPAPIDLSVLDQIDGNIGETFNNPDREQQTPQPKKKGDKTQKNPKTTLNKIKKSRKVVLGSTEKPKTNQKPENKNKIKTPNLDCFIIKPQTNSPETPKITSVSPEKTIKPEKPNHAQSQPQSPKNSENGENPKKSKNRQTPPKLPPKSPILDEFGEKIAEQPLECEFGERASPEPIGNLYFPQERENDAVAPLKTEPPTHSDDGRLLFWFDAYEDATHAPGTVFLFAKTSAGSSVCVKIKNVRRVVYLQLKTGLNITEKECLAKARTWLKKHKIEDFSTKIVKRKYCFGDFDAKKEDLERSYVKCGFPFKTQQKALAEIEKADFCEKVLGGGASALELFLVKRRLQGPGWIYVAAGKKTEGARFSWCKEEIVVEDAKRVTPMGEKRARVLFEGQALSQTLDTLETPPLFSCLGISVESIREHSEQTIVAISAVFVPRLDTDCVSPDDLAPKRLRSVSCVRPLSGKAFPDAFAAQVARQNRTIRLCSSERELLNYFLAKVQAFDPDILVGHQLCRQQLNLLLGRMKALQVHGWSRVTRLKRRRVPFPRPAEKNLGSGRLYCDTWLAAAEFSGEKSYGLGHFAARLGAEVREFGPAEVERRFGEAEALAQLIGCGCNNAFVALKLMQFLCVLPLTKQLTQLCGNLWSGSLLSRRAERNEYLLLHELHKQKYIAPGKKSFRSIKKEAGPSKRVAQYTGGLVLEPEKGLYEKIVALLDFASLYPSIIKEYNICFTTISKFDENTAEDSIDESILSSEAVLPGVVDRLLSRRKAVKALIKKTKAAKQLQTLDLRQKALKLVANSLYGCLGYEKSRFHCQKMAERITLFGRKSLLAAKEAAESVDPSLKVIYGDTDSIMVATGELELPRAKKVAAEILKAVNKRYRFMALELEGFFRCLLLLQKKKYAAQVIEGEGSGEAAGALRTRLEMKGIDLVRREWCEFSKSIGNTVLQNILSTTKPREEITESVLLSLREAREKLGEVPPEHFVITKALSKDPKSYNDANSLPHVQVALSMRKEGSIVSAGDHISYVIVRKTPCAETDAGAAKQPSLAERAVAAKKFLSPESRPPGAEVDTEWYLSHQVFPPIARLCAPIPELSAGLLGDCLGLKPAGPREGGASCGESFACAPDAKAGFGLKRDVWRFWAAPDEFRVALSCRLGCDEKAGGRVWRDVFDERGRFALVCGNKSCESESLLDTDADVARFINAVWLTHRALSAKLFEMPCVCNGLSCHRSETAAVFSSDCDDAECKGTLKPAFTRHMFLGRLLFLKSLFSFEEAAERAERGSASAEALSKEIEKIPKGFKERLEKLSSFVSGLLNDFEYYFVDVEEALGRFFV